ncbi:MAG: HPr kinase/phosphorylase [Mesorhizobium sp.]
MTAPPPLENIHATAIILGERGLLITGDSGSGKTTLARALIAHWQATGRFARLVSDDQVFLTAHSGRLIARAPATIAGLVEVHGLGIVSTDHQPAAVIDMIVQLRDAGQAARMPEPQMRRILGIDVPLNELPARNIAASLSAVAAFADAK